MAGDFSQSLSEEADPWLAARQTQYQPAGTQPLDNQTEIAARGEESILNRMDAYREANTGRTIDNYKQVGQAISAVPKAFFDAKTQSEESAARRQQMALTGQNIIAAQHKNQLGEEFDRKTAEQGLAQGEANIASTQAGTENTQANTKGQGLKNTHDAARGSYESEVGANGKSNLWNQLDQEQQTAVANQRLTTAQATGAEQTNSFNADTAPARKAGIVAQNRATNASAAGQEAQNAETQRAARVKDATYAVVNFDVPPEVVQQFKNNPAGLDAYVTQEGARRKKAFIDAGGTPAELGEAISNVKSNALRNKLLEVQSDPTKKGTFDAQTAASAAAFKKHTDTQDVISQLRQKLDSFRKSPSGTANRKAALEGFKSILAANPDYAPIVKQLDSGFFGISVDGTQGFTKAQTIMGQTINTLRKEHLRDAKDTILPNAPQLKGFYDNEATDLAADPFGYGGNRGKSPFQQGVQPAAFTPAGTPTSVGGQ